MRGFVLAALALAAVVPSSGIEQLIRVDVSLGDVSINKVPQLVAADQASTRSTGSTCIRPSWPAPHARPPRPEWLCPMPT
jgi:hypothetical protein